MKQYGICFKDVGNEFSTLCSRTRLRNRLRVGSRLRTLEHAAGKGDAGMVVKLLGVGEKANENNIHRVTEGGHEDIVCALLLCDPQLSNCQNTSKELPNFVAVEHGRVDILRIRMNGDRNLVASLNTINNNLGYQSELHQAVDLGDMTSVKVLLEAGKSIHLRGKDSNLNDHYYTVATGSQGICQSAYWTSYRNCP